MKERPIIFSGPMVRAILDGRKTQTRRLIRRPAKVDPEEFERAIDWAISNRVASVAKTGPCDGIEWRIKCPYGQPGDRLWVRETFSETDGRHSIVPVAYRADGELQDGVWKWTPSLFMPRWASRLTLEVVSVRVQRLQDITEADALAEGFDITIPHLVCGHVASASARENFKHAWHYLHGMRAPWEENPWVWAVEFLRVQA